MNLNLNPNFFEPGHAALHDYRPGDDFLAALTAAHAGLDADASAALNTALVLLLANHVGDLSVLREALQHARAMVDQPTAGHRPGSASA